MLGRILVVEDDQALLDLYTDLLSEEGYEVVSTRDVATDATQVAQRGPDLILLDVLLGPRPAGLELLRSLRAHTSTARIPVLLLTGARKTIEPHTAWLQAEGVPVIEKPFDVDLLLGTVAALTRPQIA